MIRQLLGPPNARFSRQVDNEREVVVEERLSRVEDSVDGALDELMWKQAFKSHPYRWPVLGWMKDIKAVTQEKAVAFYRRFYTPANAVVVVAGRFDEAAALATLGQAYGGVAAADPTERREVTPERAPATEVRAVIKRPVPADRMAIGFPAPGLGDPDRAAYEILAEILAGGPSSRLVRELIVDKELASSVNGDVAPTRDPGLRAGTSSRGFGSPGGDGAVGGGPILGDSSTPRSAQRPVFTGKTRTAPARG